MRSSIHRLTRNAAKHTSARSYSTEVYKPRHLMTIGDLSPSEFSQLVLNAASHKKAVKGGQIPEAIKNKLLGQTVAMMFSKRSTRTRVSTEAAVALMGGHPMFLGKDDIQLGVNESLYDTSKIISSMTSCMVARVGPHSDVAGLAEHSSVPVINALSNDFHPLQTIADFLTIHEVFSQQGVNSSGVVPDRLKVAWVGDANNVLFDLAIGCIKLGVDISVATPPDYRIPENMMAFIKEQAKTAQSPGTISEYFVPEEAVKDANVIVTDTWVSMGQEEETQNRLKAFAGFRVTDELAKRGGAKADWKFMHCLPRHPEEVSDEVMYGPRSLVFQEGENRLWAAIAALEGFVANKGNLV
ncbi:putative ornithine carbamoyl transferase [Xylaria bambusicola]|uniref:putative ornithine carbamoyl transferase n=1 Tax=Xylaria bambusicola TaxID=326684 RepID=UPI0020085DAE|nr:putative ornithine carbamoyl transferase [Xylaria bambusicola]KAI0517233.1 putative ornithine carbamoyl transferase [Xylaria bambusicola]